MAYTHIASRADGSSDGNGFTSGTLNTTGANFGAVGMAQEGSSGVITDSGAHSWTEREGAIGFADTTSSIWEALNLTPNASHTVSASGSGNMPSIVFSAFSGAATSSAFDQTNESSNLFTTDIQPGSVTPTENDELLLVCQASIDSGGGSQSVNGGFTMAGSVAFGGNNLCVGMAYLIQTTAAAANPTMSGTAGLANSAIICTYKAAAGGGGGDPVRGLLRGKLIRGGMSLQGLH